MRCRRVYCGECVTKIGGVNLCPGCLGVATEEQAAVERGAATAPKAAAGADGRGRQPTPVGLLHRVVAWTITSLVFGLVALVIFLLSISPAVLARLASKLS